MPPEDLSTSLLIRTFEPEVELLGHLLCRLIECPLITEVGEDRFADLPSELADGQVSFCVLFDLWVLHFHSHELAV